MLKENGAGKLSIEIWGKRRLAYPIQKFQDGIYVLTYYTGDGTQVAKIEKEMRFSEEVIRYLTLKQEEDFEFEEKAVPEPQAVSVEPKEEVAPPGVIIATDKPVQETEKTEEVTPKTETEEVAVEA